MSMNHRASVALVNDSGNADLGQSYLVNAFSVGGTVVSTATTLNPTLRVGHGFQIGDVLMVGLDTTKVKTVTAVDATSVTWVGTISLSAGDLLVNLGPDSLTGGTPDYDKGRVDIFSDMDGSTAVSNAQVTADSSTGHYGYFHEGAGHHWELIRTPGGVPLKIIAGVGNGPLTPGDYGATGDTTDEVGQLQALFWACSGLSKPIVFPPAKTYIISTGIDMQTFSNVHVVGNASTIKFDTSDDSSNSDAGVHTESILWFKTSSNVHIDGLNFNGNLSNRAVSGSESFNDCISLDQGCSDVLIENCFITEGMTDGIALLLPTGTSCERIKILNNRITKCRRNNISVISGVDVDIIGNLLEDGGLSDAKGTAPSQNLDIEIETVGGQGKADRIKVLHNTLLRGTGVYAMNISSQVAMTDIDVSHNIIRDHVGGPAASPARVATTAFNWSYKSGGVTVGNTGCQFTNNIVAGNAAGGVRTVSDAVDLIADNVIHTNGEHGIQAQTCEMITIEGNRIHHNGTAGTGLGIGILSSGVSGELTVKDNTFFDNDGLAVNVTMSTDDALFLFQDNYIYDTQGTATQGLCSRTGSGTNIRVIARGNTYRDLLTKTYTSFNIVTDDMEIDSAAELSGHPTFQEGISVGDDTDSNVSCLTVRRASGTKTIAWDETNGRFDLDDSLEIQTSMHLAGSFGESCLMQAKSSEITLSTGGATTDTSGLLLGNSVVLGVVARVTELIVGGTNWSLGDTNETNRFSIANSTLTLGETAVGLLHRDNTAASTALGALQAASADFRITCGTTPSAGKIRVTVFLMSFVTPTS